MKAKSKTSVPDPTIIAVIERLTPLLEAHLAREAAHDAMRADIRARELALATAELDLRVKEHEMRAAEAEVELAERRARLVERVAPRTKATPDAGSRWEGADHE